MTKKFQRYMMFYALFNLLLLMTGCTSEWTSTATNDINLLVPAIDAMLGILIAFAGLSPSVLDMVNKWGAETTATLTNVIKPLIDQYNAAEADEKPGILGEIKTAFDTLAANMQPVFGAIHVTNPATQAKIEAILGSVQAEIMALVNLVPVLQGQTSHAEARARFHALLPAEDFRKQFNELTVSFGRQYQI